MAESPTAPAVPGEQPLQITFGKMFRSLWSLSGPGFWAGSIFMGYIGHILARKAITLDVNLFFGAVVLGPLVLGGTLMLNDYFDREDDRGNPRKARSPILRGIVDPVNALHASLALMAIGLSLAAAISREFALLSVGAAVLAVAYSTPPVRLKRVGGFDLVANLLGFGVLCPLGGWTIAGGRIADFPLFFLWVSLGGVASAYLATTLVDYEADTRAGVRSIAVKLGRRATYWGGFVAMAVASAAVLYDGFVRGPQAFLYRPEFVQRVWPLAVAPVGFYAWFVRLMTPRNFWFTSAMVAFSVAIPNILFLLWYAGVWRVA
ncbi:MAG: UbiA prenyltransferase family protein [Euryarchaeota archaeon]|nr:UbiA prenyltransferase family protein [Euryarchaeota archaeon]